MAKVEVTGLKKAMGSLQKQIEKKGVAALLKSSQTIENEIIITILSGDSPVAGKKFKPYSAEYARRSKGGNRKPVDMKVTGEMLDSLSVKKVTGKNAIVIAFASKIAAFHDILGAGPSKVIRRLLPNPSKGETFRSNILKEIRKALKKGIK